MTTKTILVVEDNAELRDMYRVLLGTDFPDCIVRTAEDGVDALELLKRETFDIVITDLSMPGLNGSDLYKRVGERYRAESREMPPFIFCSAVKEALDKVASLCVGNSNRMMPKPFEIDVMEDAIRELLCD